MFKTIFISLSWIFLLFKVQSDKQVNLWTEAPPNHLTITCLPSHLATHCNCTVENKPLMERYSKLFPIQEGAKDCHKALQIFFDEFKNLLPSKKETPKEEKTTPTSSTRQLSCGVRGKVSSVVLAYVGKSTYEDIVNVRNGYHYYEYIPEISYKLFHLSSESQRKHSGEVSFIQYVDLLGVFALKIDPTQKDIGYFQIKLETYFKNCSMEYSLFDILVRKSDLEDTESIIRIPVYNLLAFMVGCLIYCGLWGIFIHYEKHHSEPPCRDCCLCSRNSRNIESNGYQETFSENQFSNI